MIIDHLFNFIKKHLKKFNNMNNKGQKNLFFSTDISSNDFILIKHYLFRYILDKYKYNVFPAIKPIKIGINNKA